MCSINGFTWEDQALAERMNAATTHRGPDGTQTSLLPGLTLGFNRLAIIDLDERAMQPMQDASERYTLIFNGEIYNYRELKKELPEYSWKTESDTEVILAAYAKWGKATFGKLNGMFALALYDKDTEELILARDKGGIKPLYYYEKDGRLSFSSELPALLEAGVPRKLDTEALGHYLRLKYVPAPLTMVQGVRKLIPGHVLIWKAQKARIEAFPSTWPEEARPSSYVDAQDAVRKVLEESVERQLVADVPVGLYLSGGIDSSIILAAASKTHPAINTFSIGFDLSEAEEGAKFNIDSVLARKTAAHFGAAHHEFFLSSNEVLDIFSDAIRHMSEPVGNATALAQLYLARKTKELATVVLTGDGGDELFGGYERYRLALRAAQIARVTPACIDRFLPGSFSSLHARGLERFEQLMFEKDTEICRVLSKNFLFVDTKTLFAESFKGGDIAEELMRTDEQSWLIDESLLRGDNMSMAASLEARVPFLDEEVRALAYSLPREWKVDGGRTKKILKDAFDDVLPKELLIQPKRGWFSPGAKWLRRDDFVKFADEIFTKEYVGNVSELFDIDGIRTLWEEHRDKRAYHYTLLWSLLTFFVWVREHDITV